jgi:hypothetical protein
VKNIYTYSFFSGVSAAVFLVGDDTICYVNSFSVFFLIILSPLFLQTLEKEHMMQESTSTIALTATGSSVSSSSSSLEHFNSSLLECSEDEEYDVELGNNVTSHSVAAKSSRNDENDGLGQNDAVASTPSCEHDIVLNLYKKEDYACASSDVPTSSSSLVATSESAMMSSTLPSASESAHHNSVQLSCPATEVIEGPSNDDTTVEPTTLTSNEEEDRAAISNTTPRRREVTITDCSICRSSYEPSESICYSSNPRCPHVFHSDCMIQWLIALGRRNDEIVIGHGKKLREGHLLEYTLSCPCCRQPFFVQSSEILRKSDVDEEKHVLDSNDSVSEVGTHVDEMEEDVVEQGNASVVFTLPQ